MEVEQASWPPRHSDALREYHAKGMSYAQIARVINARFATCYTRNAALGRAKRMGLDTSGQPRTPQPPLKRLLKQRASRDEAAAAPVPDASLPEFKPTTPACLKVEPFELRCAEVDPRHLSLVELERDDCRYPYGGDEEGEAITYCGHPRRAGSSYCTPHFHLTRDPDPPPELAVSAALLMLVDTRTIFDRAMETNFHGTNQTEEAV